ncbi:nucleotidyl transferase AbiEii/AbiGii toxin family protein [Patescibacteria group bacterium]|nr:nucleotidyl transferase AbiEii/AbiGii toxin family protein [Patescibacteria group bacterium]MBU4512951.1 nucleotidyl transferase AbiEii/AbiGii toxin family protein [Patescibacteria group bacterium]MCG2692988.1 nucleotidyl transferase AbiEii/AbiGii toxin family protein [Candidatus Parcubacteria bacterium]
MAEKIITKEQEQFLEYFKKNKLLAQDFYLTGGTALALFYYQHRKSEDLDFFTSKKIPNSIIDKSIKDVKIKLNASKVEYNQLYDRRIYQFKLTKKGILKIEFTLYPFKNLKKLKKINGVFVDSLLDMGANKIMSIMDRFEPKDFFDLYFMKNDFRLENLRTAAQKKFGIEIDPIALVSRFNKVKDLRIIPQMIKKVDIIDLKNYFQKFNKKEAKMFLV